MAIFSIFSPSYVHNAVDWYSGHFIYPMANTQQSLSRDIWHKTNHSSQKWENTTPFDRIQQSQTHPNFLDIYEIVESVMTLMLKEHHWLRTV